MRNYHIIVSPLTITLRGIILYAFAGSAVAVYGAFEPGTFDVLSSYTVDSGTPTRFQPATTNTQWLYRRPFFQSGPISNGQHTLVITNLGNRFWFDFIQVEVDASNVFTSGSSTSIATSTSPVVRTQDNQSTSTSLNPLPTSTGAQASKIQPPGTSSTNATALRDGAGSSASAPRSDEPVALGSSTVVSSAMSTVSSSPVSSGVQNGSGNAAATGSLNVGSPTMEPGAIVGVAVAGFALILLVVGGWWCWRRQRRRAGRNRIAPLGKSKMPMSCVR